MENQLAQSLKKAFINQKIVGSHYDPKLIVNDQKKKEFMLNVLHDELKHCSHFFFSVAFLTQDGLAALKAQLADLNRQGVQGKILTSVYLAFNQPAVFKDLLKIPNIEVRLSQKQGFHSKGYLFKQRDYHSFIIGSSNLTLSALKVNYEWNVRLTSHDHGQLLQDIKDHMQQEWQEAELLTPKWIEDYEASYRPSTQWVLEEKVEGNVAGHASSAEYIKPNLMQKEALISLANLRLRGEQKGMVVSATGTGKTYLSAFDVAQAKPERVLFVVHREQILNKAMADFKNILGGEAKDYGILSGTSRQTAARYVFATIQTISKEHTLKAFAEDHFDYILIDEVHRAGAQSYEKVIDYFEPTFMLGMTATPERTDHFNIFKLFDYNVAYEIRLQEALEADLLCPFHYFGVTDFEKDGELISEETDINQLVEEDRVRYLIEKLDYYGCSNNVPKGLVFCSRKEEAKKLSSLFNKEGYWSTYLSGEDSLSVREREVERLEKGEIQYIFTVDIFNEGIDIPKINQVVMLRNTQSSIIFIQQLGRGLRKDKSKDYVTVIDFIGNYKNNYMIPMALSGDVSKNKNQLRKDTYDTDFISGVSTINFEEIARKQIFESINNVDLSAMKELRRAFELLRNRLGRIPYLKDFHNNQMIDPYILANKKDSYHDFLVSMKVNEGSLNQTGAIYLKVASNEFLSGMRRHELVLLKQFISQPERIFTVDEMRQFFERQGLLSDRHTLESVFNTLDLSFFTGSEAKVYKQKAFIEKGVHSVYLTDEFKQQLKDPYFNKLLTDVVETGLLKADAFNADTPLTRYQKYKRKDVLRLLNWEKQLNAQIVSGYRAEKGKFIIFITLKKGEDFAGAQMAYEDELLDPSTLKWFTRAPRTLKSPEVKKLQNYSEWDIYVFVKKSDDEGVDFYYLGEVIPKLDTIKEVHKPVQDGTEKSVVEMQLTFETPIEKSLYHYLTAED